jgi:hypothetical protein
VNGHGPLHEQDCRYYVTLKVQAMHPPVDRRTHLAKWPFASLAMTQQYWGHCRPEPAKRANPPEDGPGVPRVSNRNGARLTTRVTLPDRGGWRGQQRADGRCRGFADEAFRQRAFRDDDVVRIEQPSPRP